MALQDLNTLSRVIIAKHSDEDSDYIEEEGSIEEESIDELAEEEDGEDEIGPKRNRISEEEEGSEDRE